MTAEIDCPNAAELQQLLLGLDDVAKAASWERHMEQCPICVESAAQVVGRDEFLDRVRRAASTVETPITPVVETLISVLRRLPVSASASAPSEATATASWSNRGEATRTFGASGTGPDSEAIPERIGPFLVRSVLGMGGMGIVYKGYDPRLDRLVAVKVIRPKLMTSPELRERFLAEARAAAAVTHDHIVVVHTVEEYDGVPCIVMPLLQGESLDQRMKATNGPLPESFALRIAHESLDGLRAAHERGFTHRDIKPANLWLEAPSDRIKILDFGLAGLANEEPSDWLAGTPGYMAPEQIEGDPIDARADLFSLGCVLYRAVTGVAPYEAETPSGAMIRTLTRDPIPTHTANPTLRPDFAAIIDELLRKKTSERPASAQAVQDRLSAIIESMIAERRRTSRRRWLLAATATTAAVGAGVWFWRSPKPVAPVRFEFATDPDIDTIILTSGGVDRTVRLSRDPVQMLPPGDYSVRLASEIPGRSLRPDRFTVLPESPRVVRIALIGEVAASNNHSGAISGVAAIARGGSVEVFSASEDRTLQVWQPNANGLPRIARLDSPAKCLAITPRGTLVVTAGGDRTMRGPKSIELWDGVTLQRFAEPLQGPNGLIRAVAVSVDGQRLLSAAKEVWLWDVEKRSHVTLEGHGDDVLCAAFDASSKRLLTGDKEGNAALWDVATGTLTKRFIAQSPGEPGAVRAVAFLPKGFATAGKDGLVRLWNDTTFKSRDLLADGKGITAMAASTDGTLLASGAEDGALRVWSVNEGVLIHTFSERKAAITAIAFAPDGRHVVAGSVDGSVRLWRLPYE